MLTRGTMKAYNLMEEIVEQISSRAMEETGMCLCDHCRLDVMALALNALPSKYIATDAGDVYVRFEMYSNQHKAAIVVAAQEAIKVVMANPRHDTEEDRL